MLTKFYDGSKWIDSRLYHKKPNGILGREYPLHTNVPATTFWVGEIFDPDAADGSQMISAYDGWWYERFGGCDGDDTQGTCETEPRYAENNYFPNSMTPKENPFYLDLPFLDIPSDYQTTGYDRRKDIPWANDPKYRGNLENTNFSYMKNRWVELRFRDKVCYAQNMDAGPGEYDDFEYVFGDADARPKNNRYGGAGMDVSPSVVGYLGFDQLNGIQEGISWRFVDDVDVPDGPWKIIVTTSPYDWSSGGPQK